VRTLLMQAEVFYIYHLGEQRGPYTVRQVNHLYKCDFIDDDTLYWREGMEQWAPVTQIVSRRRKGMRLIRWGVWAGVIGTLVAVAMFFGPVTIEAWREMSSGAYESQDAYWRARAMVREAVGKSTAVKFDPLDSAVVVMEPPSRAVVTLSGVVSEAAGERHAKWKVRLLYVPDQQQWVAAPALGGAP